MRPVMTMAPIWKANKKVGNKDLREARFHQWGCEYEEFESGPGNYTVAVVEFADGSIGTVRWEQQEVEVAGRGEVEFEQEEEPAPF